MNLIETIAKHLGIEPLKKVDPNIQDTREGGQGHGPMAQAVVPAVMAAIFNKAESGNGLAELVNAREDMQWAPFLFGNSHAPIINRIADYAYSSEHDVHTGIAQVANGFMSWFKAQPGEHSAEDLRRVLDSSKQNISSYLPAGLHVGDAFTRSTLDDTTNKMEGPMSGLMHKIENLFSSNEQPEQKPAATDQ